MIKETLITQLKESYPRDVRKQLVKSILANEKQNAKDELHQQYLILGQIFSYILKECNWNIPSKSEELDSTPLEIMIEVFPKIDTTKWFENQLLMTKQNVNLVQKS